MCHLTWLWSQPYLWNLWNKTMLSHYPAVPALLLCARNPGDPHQAPGTAGDCARKMGWGWISIFRTGFEIFAYHWETFYIICRPHLIGRGSWWADDKDIIWCQCLQHLLRLCEQLGWTAEELQTRGWIQPRLCQVFKGLPPNRLPRVDFQLFRRQAAGWGQIWIGFHSAWSRCRNFLSLRCCSRDCWRKPPEITPTGYLQRFKKKICSRSAQRESIQVLERLLVGINEGRREKEKEGRGRGELLTRLARVVRIRWHANKYLVVNTFVSLMLLLNPYVFLPIVLDVEIADKRVCHAKHKPPYLQQNHLRIVNRLQLM